jgi:ABC-type dipeptide/oligopeptide/nickel transport system permease subunit
LIDGKKFVNTSLTQLYRDKDKLWLYIWLTGLALLWLWNILFLNHPALVRLGEASLNTLFVGVIVVALSALFGWMSGLSLHFLEQAKASILYISFTFLVNLIRSIPQIIGVLIGYVLLTMFIANHILVSEYAQLLWMAFVISVFVFLEISDLVRERIQYYQKLDFYDAMLCCGISERRIINVEILAKNSRAHLLQKLIAIFGTTIFLLCSIDFIVSVGLSTDVSLSNFPMTLGGLLAKMDSKQDILAIGAVISDWSNLSSLLFEHLQGISTAFLIVFTLLCQYKISSGFVRRLRL